jgi:hypothetical protein
MTEQQPDDNAPTPAGGKKRRGFRFYLLIFSLALIAAHQIFNLVVGLRLKAEFRRIRATGAPVTMTEAAPPKVPDNQNAAPLYQRAYEGLYGWPELDPIYKYIAYLRYPKGGPPPPLEQVSAVLAANEDFFRLVESGSRLSVSRFPVDWEAGMMLRLPHRGILDNLTQLLLARALVAAKQGQSQQAWESLAAVIRIADQVGAEPDYSTLAVEENFVSSIFRNCREILGTAPPTETQCRYFYQVLKQAETSRPLDKFLEAQRAEGIWSFDYVRRESPTRLVYGGGRHRRGPNLLENSWRLFRPFWEPFLKLDELYYLRRMQQAIQAMKAPFPQSREQAGALERRTLTAAPHYAFITRMIWQPLQFTQFYYYGLQAQLQIMQVAMALRAYQIKLGKYPDTLAELSRLGWEIPLDPFSGKPLIYRKSGAGYILYSVGKNRKDDGGLPSKGIYSWGRGDKDIVLLVEK